MPKTKGDNLAGIFDEVQGVGSNVPRSMTRVKVLSVAEDETNNGLKQFTAQVQILKPKELNGTIAFERFVVGRKGDEHAVKADTWKAPDNWGARRMREFIEKAGGPLNLAPGSALKKCEGKYLGIKYDIKVDTRKTNKDGSDNEYFGQEQQRATYYKDGARTPAMLEGAKPKAKLEPDEDEEEADEPKAKAKVKPKAKPKLEPEEDEEEEDEEEEEEDSDEEEEDEEDEDEDEDEEDED